MTFSGGIPSWTVAVLFAGCAAVLVVLHLLRIRPREVRVITTLFWDYRAERTRARTLLQRFRHLWTYLLLLSICALLVLALGRPKLTGDSAGRVHEVIVLDAGASMAAVGATSGCSRFEDARAAVMAEAERLSRDDRLTVLAVDPWPRVVHGAYDPRAWLRPRLEALSPAEQPSARREALTLARCLVRGKSSPRIVLVTDHPERDASPPSVRYPIETEVIRVGEPVSNAAVVCAMFEPSRDHPLRGRFRVRVGFWGERAGEVTARIHRAGGAPLLEDTALIAPGETYDFGIVDLPADGDELIVEVSAADSVMADNRVRYRVPLRSPIRVSFRDAVPVPLRLALESDSVVRVVEGNEPADVAVLTEGSDPSGAKSSIVVIESGRSAAAGAIEVAGRSPLVSALDFEGAVCGTGVSLSLRDDDDARLVSGDAVLAAVGSDERGPILRLGSALLSDDSTVPRRAAFAVFVSRALHFLAGVDADPVVLTPERMQHDPLWVDELRTAGPVVSMPGSRSAGDTSSALLAEALSSPPASRRWAIPALFEIALLLALALFLVEAVLYTRGRIP